MRYRLQRRERFVIPNIVGNRSMPVYSYRWKDILASDSKEALLKYMPDSKNYRIEDTRKFEKQGEEKWKWMK